MAYFILPFWLQVGLFSNIDGVIAEEKLKVEKIKLKSKATRLFSSETIARLQRLQRIRVYTHRSEQLNTVVKIPED